MLDNVGEDCPVFDGLYEFSSISAGGSMCNIFIYIYNIYFLYFNSIKLD